MPEPTPTDPQSERPRRLATYAPHTLIVDDLAITPEGTSVPDDQVDHVRTVAAENGVTVYEMES
jgi:hypothetical protein